MSFQSIPDSSGDWNPPPRSYQKPPSFLPFSADNANHEEDHDEQVDEDLSNEQADDGDDEDMENENYGIDNNDNLDNEAINEDEDDRTSTSSTDLHNTRPNRWRGHPSTWLEWTEKDRDVWTALKNVRGEELAVHLYNVAGVKRGFREGLMLVAMMGEEDEQDEEKGWNPGNMWTAWPMKVDELPDDWLIPRVNDVNEPLTYRREQEQAYAGTHMEEEISATILRFAKEKFWKRGLQPQARGKVQEQVAQSIEKDVTSEGDTDVSDKDEDETDEARIPRKRKRLASPTLVPVMSADDDRSYALLRPVARRIMAKLDDTLVILHNQRVAALGDAAESSASDEDETENEAVDKPEEEEMLQSSRQTSKSPTRSPSQKRGGGRPKKVQTPREGETEQQMLKRLAREGKRKVPIFDDNDSDAEQVKRRGRGRGRRPASAGSRASSKASSKSSRSSTSSDTHKDKRMSKMGLRNWRDILGAAALAGFSPAVIERATQRCSTLFREEMTMHTLHEKPSVSGTVGMETKLYAPELIVLSSEDEEDESADEWEQIRTVSRQSSVKPPGMSSPEPDCPYPNCTKAAKPFQKRFNLERHIESIHKKRGNSTEPAGVSSSEPESGTSARPSRSATPGLLTCPYANCPRASKPFPKRSNLDRHINTVHEKRGDSTGAETPASRGSRSATPGNLHLCSYPDCFRAVEGFTKRMNLVRHIQTMHGKRVANFSEDEDSYDEMEGGVHVDGFLKPIKFQKGWRGDDTQQRYRRWKRAREGSEELDSFLEPEVKSRQP
ncbi:hypothetical protein N0V88_006524 [Collariella sp. IMI 366227]|nr:hypothetical protein N0V88_006524 [Collariella sp. IMI 366227]